MHSCVPYGIYVHMALNMHAWLGTQGPYEVHFMKGAIPAAWQTMLSQREII